MHSEVENEHIRRLLLKTGRRHKVLPPQYHNILFYDARPRQRAVLPDRLWASERDSKTAHRRGGHTAGDAARDKNNWCEPFLTDHLS